MGKLAPQPGIMDIALYQGGKSAIAGHEDVLKLSSNENPLGPPPSAQEAMVAQVAHSHLYPSTDHESLRRAIAAMYDLDPARIICGVGSDEVLQFVTQAFAGPGDEIIHTAHGFSMYPVLINMAGATPVVVPERARAVDVDAILAALSDKTRVILVTNPGNPTGTFLDQGEMTRLVEAVPPDVVVVFDGAYTEYVDGYDGGAALVEARDNVLMTRTFSKIYGLGGLRIGWGYGGREMIEIMTRIRQPFNLSGLQLAAGEAAVRDRASVRDCAALNAKERTRLRASLMQLGVACDESHTNFVLARFASPQEAKAANATLLAAGIIVREVGGYGFPEALRITVGDTEQTGRVIAALTEWREAGA